MNKHTITLSSSSSSHVETLSTIQFDDHTELTVDLSQISERIIPIYVKMNWGDGNEEQYDTNNIYSKDGVVNPLKFSPLLSQTYNHEYFPSETSLYKSLSAQFLVEFSDGNYCWFVQPIEIKTYDYFESIEDLKILNFNILPDELNSKEYQFKTKKDGYLIELRGN